MATAEQLPNTTLAIMVPVDDAMAYARDVFAGVDHLLIELGDFLVADLPAHLPAADREALAGRIRERIAAARETISEESAAQS